jgi:cofilin
MAAASGVSVNDEVVDAFNAQKLGKKAKYIQMKVSDDNKQIIVDPDCDSASITTLEQVVAQLPPQACRWGVFDFHYDLQESGERNKLVFVAWCPDTAKIKDKMLYASSKDTLKRKLLGIAHEIQATDLDELTQEALLEKVTRK